jgi:hypothetical protein
MSKKTILSENQVRQFMKYADIGGLADGFVNEMYQLPEEEVNEAEEEFEADVAVEPDVDLDPDPEAEPEAEASADEGDVQSLVQAIADAIVDETGVAVSVEGSEAGVEGGEEDLGDLGEPDVEFGDDEVVADVEEEEPEIMESDRIASMVTERVARRLRELTESKRLAEARSAKIDNIADRILERISKS